MKINSWCIDFCMTHVVYSCTTFTISVLQNSFRCCWWLSGLRHAMLCLFVDIHTITKATHKYFCKCNNRKLKFGKFRKLSEFVLFCSYSPSPVGGAANPLESAPPASLSAKLNFLHEFALCICCLCCTSPSNAPQTLRLISSESKRVTNLLWSAVELISSSSHWLKDCPCVPPPGRPG